MSDDEHAYTDAAKQFLEGSGVFAKMWTDFASQMAKSGMAFSPESTPPEASREIRSAFFQAWSQYCEEYLRSPQFLATMKQSLNSAVELRKQMNEFLGRVQHEFQGTSRQDVDQLMLTMRHVEQRLVDGLERVSERLDDLNERLDALENRPAPARRPTRRASKKPASGAGNSGASRKTRGARKTRKKTGKKRSARRKGKS